MQICSHVRGMSSPLTLCKVKSHVGIIGNECADLLAKSVALGDSVDSTRELTCSGALGGPCTPVPDSNDRGALFWLYRIDVEAEQREDGAPPRRLMRPLANLSEALREHLQRTTGMGFSDSATVYYRAWAQAMRMDLHPASNAFLTSPGRVAADATALKLRTGTLWTAKWAHRCGRRDNARCPLCGRLDSGMHAVLGCRATHKQRVSRHHATGRRILRELQRGCHAAGLYTADVGNAAHCARDDCPYLPARVPRVCLGAVSWIGGLISCLRR